jgi:Flp pilus assembly protein TadD
MKTDLNHLQSALLLVVLAFACYAGSLDNGFVWDDQALIVENQQIRNCTYLPAIFTHDLMHAQSTGTAYYRPFQTVTYMMDYAWWGLDPTGYHLTNIALHILCVLLIWLMASQLTGNRLLSWMVAALFAVHPVNTNAVTYVAGRADPLALAGMLGALVLLHQSRTERSPSPLLHAVLVAGSWVCCLVALFSRENAMLFPALVVVYGLTTARGQGGNRFRGALPLAAPYLIITVGFMMWRTAVLALHSKALVADWAIPLATRIQIPFRAMATYAGLIVWPAHLQMDRQVVASGWNGVMLTAMGVALVAGLIYWIRWSYRHSPISLFGLGWFGIMIAPMLGGLSLVATVAEHWLYAPSVGLYLALTATVVELLKRHTLPLQARLQHAAVTACAIAIALLALRTNARNADWADPLTFFSRTQQQAPYSLAVRNNLGLAMAAEGKLHQAKAELEKAEQLAPGSTHIKNNLALVYFQMGRSDLALAKIRECLTLDPRNQLALKCLADIHESRGEIQPAQEAYRTLISQTLSVESRLNFARFLVRHDNAPAAIPVLEEAFHLEPGNAAVFNLLGYTLATRGAYARATASFQLAADLDRHNPDSRINLGRIAILQGDLDTATTWFHRALEIRPDDVRPLYQLALISWRRGDADSARNYLLDALAFSPKSQLLNQTLLQINQGHPYPHPSEPSAPSI